jgi:hypothetical protein
VGLSALCQGAGTLDILCLHGLTLA